MKVLVLVTTVYIVKNVLAKDFQCCPEEALYDTKVKRCIDVSSNSSVEIIPSCKEHVSIVNNTFNLSYSVVSNGVIVILPKQRIIRIQPRQFCVATTVDNKNALILCSDTDDTPESTFTDVLYFLSGIMFGATALIYFLLPELRDLHGKIICTLCGVCSIGSVLTPILHKLPSNIHLCATSGFIVYFCNMSSFYWMNNLAVQVFRSVSTPNRQGDKEKDYKYYAFFGWGFSLINLVCALIANYVPGNHYIPGFGSNTCWFDNKNAIWTYYYGPATIIIIINSVLYFITIIKIWKSNTAPSQRYTAVAYRVWMSARLFVVVGIMWMFILANSALGYNPVLGILGNIYQMVHGIIIFILLVLRRRVINALTKRGVVRVIPTKCFLIAEDEEVCIEESVVEGDDMTVDVPLDR